MRMATLVRAAFGPVAKTSVRRPWKIRPCAPLFVVCLAVVGFLTYSGRRAWACPIKPPCACGQVLESPSTACRLVVPNGSSVYLLDGKVEEAVTDASLPGVGFGWAHGRTYHSGFSHTNFQGEHWDVNLLTAKLKWTGDEIDVCTRAGFGWWFSPNNGGYDPPKDYKASLVWYKNVAGTSGTADGGTKTTLETDDLAVPNNALKDCLIRFSSADPNNPNNDKVRVVAGNTKSDSTTTITWEEELPQAVTNEGFEILDRVVLTFDDNLETYEFAGNNANWDDGQKGFLLSRTDAYGNEMTVTYNETIHRPALVTTTSAGSVIYAYVDVGGGDFKIQNLLAKDPSLKPVCGVVYVYQDDLVPPTYHPDCGIPGDLLLVHSCENLGAAGTATGGSKLVLTDSSAAWTENEWVGCQLVMADGSNVSQVRRITKNTETTIWVDRELPNSIVADDTYFVVKGAVRTTEYRYYKDSDADGSDHQIKGVFEPDAVQRIIEAGGANIPDAMTILTKGCSDIVADGKTVADYASRAFTYYITDFHTDVPQHTAWSGGDTETLDDTYGGSNFNETGYAKSETIRSACGGCGGGPGGGVTHTFYYMNSNTPSGNMNQVCHLVVEDVTDSDGAFDRRKVYGLNEEGVGLREVTATGQIGSPTYRCESQIVGAADEEQMNQPTERRMPSAHQGKITGDADLQRFLDPTGGDPAGKNDTDTVHLDAGVIYVYDRTYDGTSGMLEKEYEGIANGRDPARNEDAGRSTANFSWLSGTLYGDGTPGHPERLPDYTYVYPQRVTDEEDTSRIETTYTYTFFPDTNDTQLETQTTEHQAVPFAPPKEHNGSNVPIESKVYYDEYGNLRWTQDGEKRVGYYAYDADNGRMILKVEDVKTNDLPPAITETWEDGPPDGFTYELDDALVLITRYEYDDLGRQTKLTEPGGRVTYTVYLANETRVYRAWDAETDKPLLPIQVTRTDDGGNLLDSYAVDPANVSLTEPPTGAESLVRSESVRWLSWTHNNYDETGRLESVDRYHAIPADDGDAGEPFTNFLRTSYAYDTAGRRYKTVAPSGHITWTEFDALGRTIETWRGTNDTNGSPGDPGGSGDPANNMMKVQRTFYDESTPGTHTTAGVGDGLVTSTCAYYDAYASANPDTNAVKTIYWYDWRGNRRAVRNEAAPHTVQDVDNMGRVVATAQYQGNLTWTTVIADDDYAATQPGPAGAYRGLLAKSLYDELGRVYRNETYAIDPDSGSVVGGGDGDHLKTDNFYDRNGHLVATTSPARGGAEYAFDGVGRQTESRLVLALEDPKYDGNGAFLYRAPLPGATTGGNDGVVQIARSTFDDAGNVIASTTLEANHVKTDGTTINNDGISLDIDSGKYDYIQTTAFSWYDAAGRTTATAAYGSGDAENRWTHAPLPDRTDRPPDRTDEDVQDGKILLTSFTYDAAGRIETVTDPKAITTKTFYDCLGRSTATVEDYKAGDTYWTVEPRQPKARAADECRITATTFDAAGNTVLLTAVDPNHDGSTADNQVTVYNYHDPYSASLVTRIKYPDSANAEWDAVTFAYALDGALATRTSQKKAVGDAATVITFDYDDTFRRMIKQRVTAAGTGVDDSVLAIGYAYDLLGRREKVTSYSDLDGTIAVNEIAYTFNNLGMLEKEYQEHDGPKDGSTLYVEYAYDDTDNTPADGVYDKGMRPKSVRYPNDRTVHTLYVDAGDGEGIGDKISRVTALSAADARPNETNVYAAFAYNGAGHLVMESQKSTVPTTVAELDYYGGTAGTYAGFDRFGRVVDQKWVHGATVLDRYGYGYDANSNRLYRENEHALAADRSEVYAYDMLDRLAGMDRGTLNAGKSAIEGTPARQEDWNLNQVGNWAGYDVTENGAPVLNQTRTNNKANEITGLSEPESQTQWVTPEYDARGNMITMPKPASPASAMTCVYDAWNRMVQARNSDGGVIATYRYDGLTRRIRKIVAGSPEVTYDYYHNPARQILETRKNGSASPYEQHVWGLRYVHSPVCRFYDQDTDGENVEKLYYANDANFNVTALLDTDGTVVERYSYDPYGKVQFHAPDWSLRSSSDYANEILFTGHRLDTETGLYYGGARYYHPTLGCWISRDRESYLEGMCLYEYCRGIPTRTVDPMGRFSFSTVGDVVESVSRAVVEAVAAAEAAVSSATGTAIRETASYVFGEGSPEEAFSRFATGVGAPTEVFTQGAFLGSLKKHAKITAARAKAKATLEAGCVYPSCQTSYDARKFVHEYIGLRGVLEGAENYIGIIGQYAPFGTWERLGKNKAEVWLGTFQGTWTPNYVDCCHGTATLEFNVTDIWNTRSMTGWSHDEERLSGEDILSDPFGALGQMWRTGKVVPGWVLSERPYGGWFGSKTLEFSWSEPLKFKGDTRCPGRN